MDLVLVALLAAAAAGAVVFAVTRARAPNVPAAPNQTQEQLAYLRKEMQRLAQAISNDTSHLGQRLETRLEGIDTRVSRTLTETHSSSQELAKGIFETLGQVTSATQVVAEQARQFNLLQDLLKPPKARGGVGEAMLEQLLVQVLPRGTFFTQHRFRSGAIVDAVVALDNRLVPIDSKFPLANYERICDADNDAERIDAERAFSTDVASTSRRMPSGCSISAVSFNRTCAASPTSTTCSASTSAMPGTNSKRGHASWIAFSTTSREWRNW